MRCCLLLLASLWLLPLAGHADDSAPAPAPLRETYPSGSIDSKERADAALLDVATRRSQMETQYLLDERACYKKFFSNDCIDDLKAARRLRQADFDAVELEAKRFKRLQHDREIQADKEQKQNDKLANAAADAAQREANRQAFERKQADAAQKGSDRVQRAGSDAPNAAAYQAKITSNSQSHSDRIAHQQVADAKAAESEASLKQKEQDAEDRRQRLAKHRAEKAADRQRRADEAAAKAAAATSALPP